MKKTLLFVFIIAAIILFSSNASEVTFALAPTTIDCGTARDCNGFDCTAPEQMQEPGYKYTVSSKTGKCHSRHVSVEVNGIPLGEDMTCGCSQ